MAQISPPTCTPSALLDDYPCLKCASTTELLAFIALSAYALNHSGSTDLEDMLAVGKCWKCTSDHQKLEGIAASMIGIAIANGYFDDAADVIHTAKCLTCTDPGIVKGIIVAETCENIVAQWPEN